MDASDAKSKRVLTDSNSDRISQLPEELLIKIVDHMSTCDAVKTSVLSKRWKNIWKQVTNLSFNMRYIQPRSHFSLAEESITKVINNHHGQLESCEIHHYVRQSKSHVLENWIRKLVLEKHTKYLFLSNIHIGSFKDNLLHLSPNTFSHPNLESLFLRLYILNDAHAFNNCHNLKILKLENIYAEVHVVNKVIASCPSLRVLVLNIGWYHGSTCLKIHNNNLKVLHLSSSNADSTEVFAPLLEIFSTRCNLYKGYNFVIKAPKLLYNSWVEALKRVPNMIYNISCHAQEKENLGNPFLVTRDATYLSWLESLAVVLDVTNSKEVELLRQILVQWNGRMRGLHILFKDNSNSKEEGESSIDEQQKNKWEETNMFLNADYRVEVLWMYNFNGSKKQFQLASCFVTQGTVMKKMMIKTSSMILANEMLDLEVVISKLKELPKGNKKLSIEYF